MYYENSEDWGLVEDSLELAEDHKAICKIAPNELVRSYLDADGRVFKAFSDVTKWRLVCLQDFDGNYKQFFQGENGEEHIVCFEDFDGNKQFLKGVKGQERTVRWELPNGDKFFYKGYRGKERIVRTVFCDSTKKFFKGAKGRERLVR